MIHRPSLFVIVLLLLFATSCKDEEKTAHITKQQTSTQQQSKKANNILDTSKTLLATVNGKSIYKEDLGSKSLDTAINYEVLYQIGLKNGVDKMFEENIENYKRKLVLTQMITKIMAGVPDTEVTDEQINTYYNDYITKYSYLDVIEFTTDNQKPAS